MPVSEFHSQSAGYDGIEGCSANQSRLHSGWYSTSTNPHFGKAHPSTWQMNAIPDSQKTATVAAATAQAYQLRAAVASVSSPKKL